MKMKISRGFTMMEIIVVCLIIGVIIGTLMQILSKAFLGTKKGYDTLSILQEETKLVSFLKYDLRTMTIPDGFPPPDVVNDSAGNYSFSFDKVHLCDRYGMPAPVRITYQREGGTRQVKHRDGTMKPVYSIVRINDSERRIFMKDMISSLSIKLLDMSGNRCTNPKDVRKVQLGLETSSSDLLQVMVSIYSPYLTINASSSDAVWLMNYRTRAYTPGAGITAYNGVNIPAADLTIIGGAIALSRERSF
ncbi:MAG: type II secretion system protein [Candidatus Riflebacteria bacterium]|nr:type II secretion system protein [Candidatus Riflebacteria bacterium]